LCQFESAFSQIVFAKRSTRSYNLFVHHSMSPHLRSDR
jgi:hypothetical protein